MAVPAQPTPERPVAQQPDPARPPASGRRWRWLLITTVAWALLVAGLGALSARRDPPTTREQRTLAQAASVVDRTAGRLAAAAASPDVVVSMEAPRVRAGCRLNVSWVGSTLERTVTVHAADAAGPGVLERVAARLPAGFAARVARSGGTVAHRLGADAGEFVGVSGEVTRPGVVVLTVGTGCRPGTWTPPSIAPGVPGPGSSGAGASVAAAAGAETELTRLRGVLDLADTDPVERATAPCPAGGTAYTVRIRGPGGALPAAGRAVARPGATVLVDRPDRYVYRRGPLGMVVAREAGRVDVTASTMC